MEREGGSEFAAGTRQSEGPREGRGRTKEMSEGVSGGGLRECVALPLAGRPDGKDGHGAGAADAMVHANKFRAQLTVGLDQ